MFLVQLIPVALMGAVYFAGYLHRHWTLPVDGQTLRALGEAADHTARLDAHGKLQRIAQVGATLLGTLPVPPDPTPAAPPAAAKP